METTAYQVAVDYLQPAESSLLEEERECIGKELLGCSHSASSSVVISCQKHPRAHALWCACIFDFLPWH